MHHRDAAAPRTDLENFRDAVSESTERSLNLRAGRRASTAHLESHLDSGIQALFICHHDRESTLSGPSSEPHLMTVNMLAVSGVPGENYRSQTRRPHCRDRPRSTVRHGHICLRKRLLERVRG